MFDFLQASSSASREPMETRYPRRRMRWAAAFGRTKTQSGNAVTVMRGIEIVPSRSRLRVTGCPEVAYVVFVIVWLQSRRRN